ncbi:putative alpha-1,2-mannosidase [Arcticibacter tournemirensis]|uniref:Glycoside hydrolase family 92 protein n=1 Tax=Arcticibacter tournemirensis TaxID=699437 RepID=A0A5M9HGC3_9SPHI|nr:GH92 family glycosyl hydrolase [Arcticibacter tournemirensis]KAA8485539.1 glycoside hydrolase family 92 protein [Arcticibacter tournemirensis]TQM48750.1 putative alpha-1,2-mannosidase [Arcticibacter tournemirensis]
MKYLIVLLFVSKLAVAQTPDLVKYVNTLQGTNSKHELTRGNTYPTTALPFGMNTWTPQTGRNGDGWKYQYFKKTIRGFQQAHQCSSWSNDYAVFSFMPVTGALKVNEEERAAGFSHDNEIARPNYYKVKLDNGITTEMSPTERGAHLRFSFPKGEKSYLVLDGYTKMSMVKIIPSERKIIGYVNNGHYVPENFRNYFVVVFDKPFKSYGTWENRTNSVSTGTLELEGKGAGAYIEFKAGEQVQAKVASSYISTEQAGLNLKRELGKFRNLEATKTAAAKIWNEHLSRILVEGGTEEEKATFYSCFFRASLFSRQFFEYDKDGKPYYYSAYDGKIHEGYMYTDTGFWDTFRAQFPLNAIMHPTMHGRYMQALLAAYEQCGWLPSWSFPGEGGSMIGNHAISLLTDAWVKGIRTFDPKQALQAYLHEATNKGPWGPANGRHGWKEYYQLGYVPYPEYGEATAKTLEYAYDDFCAWQLSKETDQPFYTRIFERQMYNYKNVYDPSTRFMRGRNSKGEWKANFDPIEWGGPYTEGNAWHWQWSVFHDVQGLINLMQGEKNFTAKLDSVFSEPNKVNTGTYGGMIHEMTEMVMANMGQYAHGNQPIQHMIYLYNYAGQPWKTQYHVRQVMSRLYNSTENGYPGDEDQGQTSSWYVLSALGFYSVCPGTDQYVIGSPVFNKVTITLENGKKFVIQARNNNAQNVYIQSAKLNGKDYTPTYIKHSDITNGGLLEFDMQAQPATQRAQSVSDRPFSLSR